MVPKHDLNDLRKISDIFDSSNNYSSYRERLSSIPLTEPCVPFLGIHLGDLVYKSESTRDYDKAVNKQAPSQGLIVLLESICNLQRRTFPFNEIPQIRRIINQQKFIRELETFIEDSQYQRSLAIEPKLGIKEQTESGPYIDSPVDLLSIYREYSLFTKVTRSVDHNCICAKANNFSDETPQISFDNQIHTDRDKQSLTECKQNVIDTNFLIKEGNIMVKFKDTNSGRKNMQWSQQIVRLFPKSIQFMPWKSLTDDKDIFKGVS